MGVTAQESINTRQFVSFLVGGECFASPLDPVQEIIRLPGVSKLPLAPPGVLGLSNLRGRVLPLLSLRRIFGFPDRQLDDSPQALVVNFGNPVGFVVDRVVSVVSCESWQIQGAEELDCGVKREWLVGVIKLGDDRLLTVVDFPKILEEQCNRNAFTGPERSGGVEAGDERGNDKQESESETVVLVTFAIDGQEYAISLQAVQEIVQVPAQVTWVPRAAEAVFGLTILRDRVLPLVSLRSLLGLEKAPLEKRQRVLVVNLDSGLAAALVVDAVKEVLHVQLREIEQVPALVGTGHGDSPVVTSLLKLNGGQRLVSVLDTRALFGKLRDIDWVSENHSGGSSMAVGGEKSLGEQEQFVVFQLGSEEFGVSIEKVQEIVRVPDRIARIPGAPDYVEGLMNLRGVVLPVVNQRRRFGMGEFERNERQRVLVCTLEGQRIGFMVDSVSEVLRVPHSAIQAAPAVGTGESKVIRRVASLDGGNRFVFLLDVDALLDAEEIARLKEVVKENVTNEGVGGR